MRQEITTEGREEVAIRCSESSHIPFKDAMRVYFLETSEFNEQLSGVPIPGEKQPPPEPDGSRRHVAYVRVHGDIMGAVKIRECEYGSHPAAFIDSLIVAEGARKNHLGTQLFDSALAYLRSMNVDYVILDTDAATSAVAHAMYEKRGFRAIDTWPLQTKGGVAQGQRLLLDLRAAHALTLH